MILDWGKRRVECIYREREKRTDGLEEKEILYFYFFGFVSAEDSKKKNDVTLLSLDSHIYNILQWIFLPEQ